MDTKCILDGRMPTYSTCVWSLSSHLSYHLQRKRELGLIKTKQSFHDNGWRYILILFFAFFNDLCFVLFDTLVLQLLKKIVYLTPKQDYQLVKKVKS